MRKLLPLLLALALLGCKKEQAGGGASEPTPTAAPNTPTETPAPKGRGSGAEGKVTNPLQAMAQLAKAGEALSKASGQPLGDVVNWRQLAPFAPDKLGEFVAEGDLDGSTGGMGKMQVSRVKRRYKAGDRTLRLEISDTSLVPMLRAGFAMATQVHEDSTKGIKKGVKVDGNPGLVEWRKARQRAKLGLLVGGRYLVQLRLRPTDSPDPLMDLIKQIDTGKLAGLKAEKK